MTSDAPIANAEMATAWETEGIGWAERWERYDRGVAAHHAELLRVASVGDGEAVLDIGCGNGQVSRDLARRAPAGTVLGVDLSTPMLDRARELAAAEGLRNAAFLRADAQVHPFDRAFDLVVSRFGTMFFSDRRAAFSHVAASMRPGARLAMVVWQHRDDNAWLTTVLGSLFDGALPPPPPEEAPSPFSLARPEHIIEVLEGAGLSEVTVEPRELPFWAGSDADDAFAFLRDVGNVRGVLDSLAEDERPAALERLAGALAAHAGDDGVVLGSAVLLVSAVRR
ncbi:MAG: class I SAM-dependent methyltransferase [Mycobacteriales bacterium]